MDSSWNEALCPLVRPPTALARRRANTTPMSHGLSVFCLIDSGSAGCPRDWCPNVPLGAAKHLRSQAAGENQTRVHCGEKDVLFTTAGRQSKRFNFQVSRTTETKLWNCDHTAFIIAQRMGDRNQPQLERFSTQQTSPPAGTGSRCRRNPFIAGGSTKIQVALLRRRAAMARAGLPNPSARAGLALRWCR